MNKEEIKTINCLHCNKEFKTKSTYIIYCSCECQDLHENTTIWGKNLK